jgi:uncharacterized protein YabN with tetrapyrrole methylase and pyrophosphatase domain
MATNVVLHMGFLNTPYTKKTMQAPMAAAKAHEKKPRRGFTATKTAEQVSNILEAKYNILEVFTEIHKDEIMELVTGSFAKVAIQNLSERRKLASDRMARYMKPKTTEIEKMFRRFLDQEEMNGHGNVPVEAAIMGKVTGRKSRAARPSFINTGVYRASFRAWVDIK